MYLLLLQHDSEFWAWRVVRDSILSAINKIFPVQSLMIPVFLGLLYTRHLFLHWRPSKRPSSSSSLLLISRPFSPMFSVQNYATTTSATATATLSCYVILQVPHMCLLPFLLSTFFFHFFFFFVFHLVQYFLVLGSLLLKILAHWYHSFFHFFFNKQQFLFGQLHFIHFTCTQVKQSFVGLEKTTPTPGQR